MKLHIVCLLAVAASLACVPLHHSPPADSGASPPGFRITVADRTPCQAPAVFAQPSRVHLLAPVPEAVFDLPGEDAATLPEAAFIFTLQIPDAEAAVPAFPLRI